VKLAHRSLTFLLHRRHAALVELPALADVAPWHRLVSDVRSYGRLPAPVLEAVELIEAELQRRAVVTERARCVLEAVD
jgi:hypothetical protein